MPSASISSTPASITFLLPLAAIGYPSADNPPRHPPLAPVFSFLGDYAFESLGMSQWRVFSLFMSGSWVFLFAQIQVTVYQCLTEGGGVAVLHAFIDEDVCTHNLLYLSPMRFCCCRGGEDIGFEIASEHLRRIAIKV
jgi:hypothetical protein